MREQTAMLAQFPDRLPRLERYGLFNIRRIPFGIIYYFFPIWVFRADFLSGLNTRIVELFDAFELPPSSFFLSDPLTIYLAIGGLILVLRGRLPSSSASLAKMLLLGLALPPVMMLMAWYMTFRYRAEFMPLLVALSCFQAANWSAGGSPTVARRAGNLLGLLCVLQIASTQIIRTAYTVSPLGPSDEYVAAGIADLYLGRITWRPPGW
jgi:hypothetical protein